MKLRRRFSSSLRTLVVYRVRSILALSGVAVGVGAVVVSRAVGAGAQQEMVRAVERMGTQLLIAKPLPMKRLVERPKIAGDATSLSLGDYQAIDALPLVHEAAPALEGTLRVKADGAAMKTTIRGTTSHYLSVRHFRVSSGRFFDDDDDRAARRVAVLGARVNDSLAPGGSLVGQEIRIGGVPFAVIGVLRAKGTGADGGDEDNQVLVPIRTALRRVFNDSWLSAVYISVTEPKRMSDAKTEIQHLLVARHQRGISRSGEDFAVQSTIQTRAFQQQMTESLSRYAAGLGIIALFVGGIGIMALMLLSVRERTSEIGLRMAVGAQPLDILLQFLIEATALALAGWVTGLILGGAAVAALVFGTNWSVAAPLAAIAGSFGMALVIGVGFGALPARKAARIPPIQALLRV